MALAISALKRSVVGSKRMSTAVGTFSGTYSAGGESITPQKLGMHRIEHLHAQDVATSSPNLFSFDYTNNKLIGWTEALVEVSSTYTHAVRLTAIGY